MADENGNKGTEVTPKGAVEIDESDLDQAAGGAGAGKVKFNELQPSGEPTADPTSPASPQLLKKGSFDAE